MVKHKEKGPHLFQVGAFRIDPAASYSSIGRPHSTIGAGGLNDRVRDGIGCDTSAIATGNLDRPPKKATLHLALFRRPQIIDCRNTRIAMRNISDGLKERS